VVISPVSGGDQLLDVGPVEAVGGGHEPELFADHIAGDRLDLAAGRLELCLQGVELLGRGVRQRVERREISGLVGFDPLAQIQQDRFALVDEVIGVLPVVVHLGEEFVFEHLLVRHSHRDRSFVRHAGPGTYFTAPLTTPVQLADGSKPGR
jgi:hypothetical protein